MSSAFLFLFLFPEGIIVYCKSVVDETMYFNM